jgi:hypothetical protein
MARWRMDVQRRGHVVVSRWIDEKVNQEGVENARRDIEDLAMAEILIQHNATERRDTRGANHSELGYSLALGHRCLIVGVAGNIFHHLCEVFPTWNEALETL